MTAEPWTAKLLVERLRRHYIKPGAFPGGVFVPECGLNNGGGGRRVDAVHIGFTSTSGRILTGHEIKVSRGDWLHELDQPHKASLWADGCHAWYVVAPSIDIVKPGELPHGWGLMVPSSRTKTRMDVVAKAVAKTSEVGQHAPPWLIVRSIFARLDTLTEGIIAERVQSGTKAAVARELAEREKRERYTVDRTVLVAKKLGELFRETGGYHDPDRVVEFVRQSLKKDETDRDLAYSLKSARSSIEAAIGQLQRLVATLPVANAAPAGGAGV